MSGVQLAQSGVLAQSRLQAEGGRQAGSMSSHSADVLAMLVS